MSKEKNDAFHEFRIKLLKDIKEKNEKMSNNQIQAALEKKFPGHKVKIENGKVWIGQVVVDYTRARQIVKEAVK